MTGRPAKTAWRRLLWFAALWAVGVATVAALGLVIKLVLGA